MLTLTLLNTQAFADFFEMAAASYASDNVAAGRWLQSDASALAQQEMQGLLAQGVDTPGHFVYGMAVESVTEPVGYLWLATLQRGSSKTAYVYQIIVKPAFRRKGYARQALQAVEVLAKAGGHTTMALNVFAQNTAAQALYASLGYHTTNMNMAKHLASGDV